ncbi:MAG: extracellular solute-binding protein [Sphaerochaetaceae bacterium]
MKIAKRSIVVLLIFVALSFSLFAGGASESSNATGKRTLKVQLIGDDYQVQDSTDALTGEKTLGFHYLKEAFEELHPDVNVEFIIMGWDSYTEKTIVMAQAGECDVLQVPGIATLAAQGLLEPLSPYIEQNAFDLDQYIDGQVNGWKALGPNDTELQVYGLPFIGDSRFISYDKQLFDDFGVEYLSERPTIEEIEEKAAKLTGINPKTGEMCYGLRFKGGSYLADTAMNISEGLGNIWGTGFAWSDMIVNFNTPEMVEAVTWMKRNMEAYSPAGMVSRQGDEKRYTPNNNLAIDLNDDPSSFPKIEALGWKDRIGICYPFTNPTYGMGGMFAGSPVAICVNSEVKDLAWEWLAFTASATLQNYFWDQYRSIPVIESALESESINSFPQVVAGLNAMSVLWTPRYPYRSSQPRTIFSRQVERALLGEQTVQEALDQAQRETTAWLKEQQ